MMPGADMLFALALLTLAKTWNGITPGESTRDDVIEKFGEPSKTVKASGRELLAYQKGNLIKGTTQTQFKVDPKTEVVERIDVFPEPKLKLADVAKAYGPLCTKEAPESEDHNCYLKRDEDKKLYIVYVRLGVAVFFDSESGFVLSFAYLPEKK
jgi:hypothetical protein